MLRWALIGSMMLASACSSSNGNDVPIDDDGGVDGSVEASLDDTGGVDASSDGAVDDVVVPDSLVPDSHAPDSVVVDSTAVDVAPEVGPTGGCGKPASSGVTTGSIIVAGTKRTYVLSIPSGYDPSKPLPLAFGFHGRTGDGASARSFTGVETAAGGKAIFVYPDGLTVTPSNPKDTGWDLSAGGRDVALFDALVTELSRTLCVDSKKIYAFGFSFGGYMSNALGCARGKVLRAIAPVAGGPSTSGCTGAVAAWIEHADDDPTVNISEGTKSRDFWVKQSGCDATKSTKVPPDPCIAYAGCSVGAPVVWCERTTGGHSWPIFAGAGIWNFYTSLP